MPPFQTAVAAWVALIPRGKVATYGQVAIHLGEPRSARRVGFALAQLAPGQLPWHRVVNARGEISVGGDVFRPDLQHRLLFAEVIIFDARGRINLHKFRWQQGPLWLSAWPTL